MYKEVAQSRDDTYNAAVTKKWSEEFKAVRWLKMPKVDVELPTPIVNTPRNRTISSGSARGSSSKGDATAAAASSGYGGQLSHADTEDIDFEGSILYHPSLETEEQELFQALFACYGPDQYTICRLLCRPDASLQVQVSAIELWSGSKEEQEQNGHSFNERPARLAYWHRDLCGIQCLSLYSGL